MTAVPPQRSRKQPRRLRRALIITGAAIPAVLFAGYVIGRSWVESYLRSPEFLRFVGGRIGNTIQSDVELQPLRFNGLMLYSGGLRAQGYEGGPFSSTQLDEVRAEFSMRRFFDKVWQVESVEATKLSVQLDGPRLSRPVQLDKEQKAEPTTQSGHSASWLPNRVEVSSAVIHDFEINWGTLPTNSGALKGVELRATPADGGWAIEGRHGDLQAAGLPKLTVDALKLRQREGALFINAADFLADGGGSVKATGEVAFDHHVDVQAKVDSIDIAPFLSSDWRMRLKGRANADVRIQSSLPVKGPIAVSGTLELKNGRLEALPILDQIATFTKSQQFRSLTLTRASARFEQKGNETRVRDFVAESEGLTRMEGQFVVSGGQIDGTFQVGVAPSTLQWLPGSQERVFTQSRDGYVWTSMRLTGPVDSPTEDLSPRLLVAAGGALIDKAQDTTRDAIQLGRDAAQGALNLLFPKSR